MTTAGDNNLCDDCTVLVAILMFGFKPNFGEIITYEIKKIGLQSQTHHTYSHAFYMDFQVIYKKLGLDKLTSMKLLMEDYILKKI